MASRRVTPTLNINTSNAVEEQWARFVRGTTPWIAWLIGCPVAALLFWLLARITHQHAVVTAGLCAATAVLTAVVWRATHARGWGRIHHALNAVCSLGWVTSVTAYGWMAGRGIVLIGYAIGGLILTLTWNVRYTTHTDGVEDVLTPHAVPAAKKVDMAYVVRVLAGHAPAIRAAAEKGGKVVPALAGPWREQPREALATSSPHPAIAAPAGEHVDAQQAARAQAMWEAISKNWRNLAAEKVHDLNGARLVPIDIKPWRIRSRVKLVRGVQTPKLITDHREILASQNALPLASVLVKPNPRNHAEVYLDWVLEDVLAATRMWPGPHATGKSIADAPSRVGLYEDRQYAERFGPAITAEMAKRLGRAEKNLSHLLSEGVNGSGKSNESRIRITDGATRIDVEDWVIDTVKKNQTFGQLAAAITWFATTVPEARGMIRFLADVIIPARADYLGAHGYDNWEPGCGLPYLRLFVEEGGIVANELDKLDAVLNSARSTGTEINLSVQRAHHALVDTNVRAAFGDTLSFGAKSIEDVFAMPDDLRDAGADPSLWSNKQPGMAYYAAADVDFDRQLMPVRCFKVDAAECRDIIAEHAPARAAWIAGNCPDWAALLRDNDPREVYAKRTTGAQILAAIEAGERRKAGRPAPAAPAGGEAPQSPEDAGEHDAEVVPFPQRPRLAAEDEVLEGVIVGRMGDDEVNMDELDLPAEAGDEVAEAVAEDKGIDPRSPLPPVDPADDVHFGHRERPDIPRERALRILRERLEAKGEGFEFAPRDVYDELCEATGKSPAWVRGELLDLAAAGFLRHERLEGRYTVTMREEVRV